MGPGTSPERASGPKRAMSWLAFAFLRIGRERDHDPARGDIDGRHAIIVKGDEFGRSVGKFDLDDVAGAEIVHPTYGAEKIAGRIFGFQADQIRIVELASTRGRQRSAWHIETPPFQTLRSAAVRNPGKTHDH